MYVLLSGCTLVEVPTRLPDSWYYIIASQYGNPLDYWAVTTELILTVRATLHTYLHVHMYGAQSRVEYRVSRVEYICEYVSM